MVPTNQKNMIHPKFDFKNQDEIPKVTIQLPVFNELYVMERLLDNIVELDYPTHKLEIQVLDDSTDESVESTAKQIKSLQKRGFSQFLAFYYFLNILLFSVFFILPRYSLICLPVQLLLSIEFFRFLRRKLIN